MDISNQVKHVNESHEIEVSQTNDAPVNVNIQKSYSKEHQNVQQEKSNDGNEETPVFSEKEYLEKESSTSKGEANETIKGRFTVIFINYDIFGMNLNLWFTYLCIGRKVELIKTL